MPGGLRLVDAAGRLLADRIPLGVHLVVCNVRLFHRAEGTKAHVQGHLSKADSLLLQALHQLRGEVQARGGGGSAAQLLGVHGLVLALVLQLLGDVGRQRHFAELVQLFVQGLGVIIKGNVLVAVLQRLLNFGAEGAVTEQDASAGVQALSRFGQAFPRVALVLVQQQKLTHRAGVLLRADEPGRKHLGVVGHQQIARLQQFRQDVMTDDIAAAVQRHQTGGIPRNCRLLRDLLLWQVEPKIFFQHGFAPL